jgi:hypothetical protein
MIEAIKNNPLSKTLEASRKTEEVLKNMMNLLKDEPPKIVSAVIANLSASGLLPFPGLASKPSQARQAYIAEVFKENSTLEDLKKIEKIALEMKKVVKFLRVDDTELAFLKTRDSTLTYLVNVEHYLYILRKEMTVKSNYEADTINCVSQQLFCLFLVFRKSYSDSWKRCNSV